MHRFYVEDISESNKSVTIRGKDVNHIINVLRLKNGDEIVVGDGSSRDYYCTISSIDKDEEEVIAEIVDICDSNSELPADIYLFQGVPKGDKMELIIQKCIELGVHEIIPVFMERSVVRLDDKKKGKKIDRYQGIAESASKQSRRGIIPKINSYMDFNEAVKYASEISDYILVPYESAEGMNFSRCVIENIKKNVLESKDSSDNKKISVFIGPEGGFAQSEIDKLEEMDATILSLGHRILRTETAGITILSILSFMLDD